MFQELFKRRYLESLKFYKHFYDDIYEYGVRDNPTKVFYFIPGISGVPGQVRFILPSLYHAHGAEIYVRCCHHPAFSATQPIWDKYSTANVDGKKRVIIKDLRELLLSYDEVVVIVSSNGFYDFVSAWWAMNDASAAKRLKLLWGACAPDHFEASRWEDLFFHLNGFAMNGHRWFAYPNHNLIRFINPETTTSFTWKYEALRKTFYKIDIESRFVCFNLYWAYISIGCFNEMLEHLVNGANRLLPIETHVLVAANDGYWQNRGEAEVREVIGRYVAAKTVTVRNASHLWVVTPENATALLRRLEDPRSGHDP
jgi:hypothetical protein